MWLLDFSSMMPFNWLEDFVYVYIYLCYLCFSETNTGNKAEHEWDPGDDQHNKHIKEDLEIKSWKSMLN